MFSSKKQGINNTKMKIFAQILFFIEFIDLKDMKLYAIST